MTFTVEVDREQDGRWIAQVLELPGALVYGSSPSQAVARVKALALRVVAERLERGEAGPHLSSIDFATHSP